MGNKSCETSYGSSSTGKISAAFLIGGAVGSLVTYYFTKRYYAKKANEAISSVTERFTIPKTFEDVLKEAKDISEELNEKPPSKEGPDPMTLFMEKAKSNLKEKGPSEPSEEPYVITVDEYVEDDEYDKETLIYYETDETLSDQYDHMLFIEDIFGSAWPFLLPHFGDDDEDVLYCRNPRIMTDYEIVMEHHAAPETCLPEGDEDD